MARSSPSARSGVTIIFGILRFANFSHGELMSFGAMVTILVTWLLQIERNRPRPAADRAPGPAGRDFGDGRHGIGDGPVRLPLLPPQAGEPDRLRHRVRGRDVRHGRSDPHRHRPGRPDALPMASASSSASGISAS
ncbi:MAG: hypothetical protein ACMVO3_19290 [Thalassobaculum sp.]